MLTILFRALLLTGLLAALPLHADYLKNADFKQGISPWRGDGERAYLKADGTEGAETDNGIIPVIKVALASDHPRFVFQEIETRDKPTTMHVKIEVFASTDFKRNLEPQNYNRPNWKSGGTYYLSGVIIAIPPVDFWIRGGGERKWFYKLADLTPGSWVTVEGNFNNLPGFENQLAGFCAPPGQGTLYLKNPVAEP